MGSAVPNAVYGRTLLKRETDATHERMELLAPFRQIADGTLDRDSYARLLRVLYRFHQTILAALNDPALYLLASEGERIALIEEDLRWLGSDWESEPVGWTPPAGPGLLGMLYVAEGSALGGKVIARQLDYLMGDGDDGRRFFRGRRGDGARWRRIVGKLDRQPRTANVQAAMIAGAEATFLLFESCVKEAA